jgi:hypothetical protein
MPRPTSPLAVALQVRADRGGGSGSGRGGGRGGRGRGRGGSKASKGGRDEPTPMSVNELDNDLDSYFSA